MKKKYRLRTVHKIDDKGFRRWRVEIWNYKGWIDALQGWFDSEEEAKQKIREMNDELIQEKLL